MPKMIPSDRDYLIKILDSIQYDESKFVVHYNTEYIVLGAFTVDTNPQITNFFTCKSIYETVLDLDMKIKISLRQAIKWLELDSNKQGDKVWDPFCSISFEENNANYYIENAVFRIESLWDLLAQFFNIYGNYRKPYDKIYAKQLFHDAQQGNKPDPFAKRVYQYMDQKECLDSDPWEGNYAYVKDYRDKMIHKISPNVTSFSNMDTSIRLPALYSIKRVVEDYHQVSLFLAEIIDSLLKELVPPLEIENDTPLQELSNI